MIIKQVFYLLIIGSIITMCANFTYGEEVLVFHDQPTVYVFSTSPDGGQMKKELINDAYVFDINRSGYFTMRDGNTDKGKWYKGRIDSSFNVTKQTLPSIPADITSVAISEDGKRVAWRLGSGTQKSELTIEEYIDGESKILHKISVDGLIPAFSWSPDSDLLTYFFGSPEAVIKDGFSLMLLDMKNLEKPPEEIAPPSLIMGQNPGRSSPSWSPDGKYILFDAQYNSEKLFFSGRYIISIDGRTLVPSSLGGIWDQEGKYIYRVERIGNDGSGEYMVVETDISSHNEKVHTDDILKIGTGLFGATLSPSGQKIVYSNMMSKEIFVYDTMKKNAISYGIGKNFIINGQGVFYWIFPKN